MLLIFLFCLFLLWSYIVSITADFLIHNQFRLSIPTKLQTVLLFACASSFLSLWLTILPHYPLFFILTSALWITIFTDLEHMLISRLASLYLIPVGIIANYYDVLIISPQESIIAAFGTMGILLLINTLFCKIKGHNGLGQGDIELMGCIAAWLGCLGAWFTLLIGSTIGVISCLLYMLWTRTTISMIPFGPFLSLGSLIFMIFSKNIINFLMMYQ